MRSVDLAASHVVCDRQSSPEICGGAPCLGLPVKSFLCYGNSRNMVLGPCQIMFLSEFHVPVARSVVVNVYEIPMKNAR